jgi:molybdopterin synthase sulfur carrier subunit
MTIQLLFFAGLREAVGSGSESLALPEAVATVGELRAHLAARGGKWAEHFAPTRNVRAAVNQTMVAAGGAVKDGDEVAFFPPVTGG